MRYSLVNRSLNNPTGKKMAGRMGGKKVTQRNNFVYMLDIKVRVPCVFFTRVAV